MMKQNSDRTAHTDSTAHTATGQIAPGTEQSQSEPLKTHHSGLESPIASERPVTDPLKAHGHSTESNQTESSQVSSESSQANANSSTEHEDVLALCRTAKAAARKIAQLSGQAQVAVLKDFAQALVRETEVIQGANQRDLAAGKARGLGPGLLDRLLLDAERIEQIASSVAEIAALPTPVGQVVSGRTLPNGIKVEQIRVPLGLIAMIYEARPNVTVDAISLALRSGNAVILRGGSAALQTNRELVRIARQVLSEHNLPEAAVTTVDQYGRAGAKALMRARGLVDVLIPRGGANLIQTCVQEAKVPVIETGTGNCHVYVDRSADLRTAKQIVINAKTHRPSVCNAAETLLIDRAVAAEAIVQILPALAERGVQLHVDPLCQDLVTELLPELSVTEATAQDWAQEYLGLEMAVLLVDGVEQAIAHITEYSSGHTEAIVANDYRTIETFTRQVDSAAIAVNTSTRFTDGGQLGLGAEIGISTQKLHARGPFALTELTTVKWIMRGQGQIRA